jgi:hypothetical protein
MYLFPTGRGVSDLCLLLAGELRRMLSRAENGIYIDEDGRIGLTMAELEVIILKLKEKHKMLWGLQHRQARSSELAAEVLDHLEEWGLAGRGDNGQIWIYAALARWNGDYDLWGGDE